MFISWTMKCLLYLPVLCLEPLPNIAPGCHQIIVERFKQLPFLRRHTIFTELVGSFALQKWERCLGGGRGDTVTSVCGKMRGIVTLNSFFSQFRRPAFFLA